MLNNVENMGTLKINVFYPGTEDVVGMQAQKDPTFNMCPPCIWAVHLFLKEKLMFHFLDCDAILGFQWESWDHIGLDLPRIITWTLPKLPASLSSVSLVVKWMSCSIKLLSDSRGNAHKDYNKSH